MQPGTRLEVTVQPDAGFDPSLYLISAPASNCMASGAVCVAGSDLGGAGVSDSTVFFNNDSSPLPLFIIVDRFGPGSPGSFDLQVSTSTPPPGDRCDAPLELPTSMTVPGESTSGFVNDYVGPGIGCPPSSVSSGGDRVYRVTVPASQRLTVTVTPEAGFDTSLALASSIDSCSSRVCLAAGTQGGPGAPDSVLYVNRTGAPAELFVVVDAASSPASGTYTLSAVVEPQPAGDLCGTAQPLADNTPVDGTTSGFSDDYSGAGAGCTAASGGADRAYALNVPPFSTASVALRSDAGVNVNLSLFELPASSCDARSCVDSSETGGLGGLNTIALSNATPNPHPYLVVVDSAPGAGGRYQLTSTVTPLPEGELCATAPILTDGGTVGATTLGYANDYTTGTRCAVMGGSDRVFAVTLPPGQRLRAQVTPTSSWDPTLSLITGAPAVCDASPLVCSASASFFGSGAAEAAWTVNTTGADQNVFVVVDGNTGGPFNLSTTIDVPPASGDRCESPAVLTPGVPLTSESTATMSGDYASQFGSCPSASAGPDAVYQLDIPAGQLATVTVTGTGGFDPSVALAVGVAGCNARLCAASVNASGANGTETVTRANYNATTISVFVIVDSTSLAGGSFSISASLSAAPTLASGDICQNAVSIGANATFFGESTNPIPPTFLLNQYTSGTGCVGLGSVDKVYVATVPPGKRFTAQVTGTSVFNPSISLVLGPAPLCDATPMVCLASNNSGTAAQTKTVRWTNWLGVAATVFILVDASGGIPATGDYALSTTTDDPFPPAPGDFCINADTAPTDGGTLRLQSTEGFTNDYSPSSSCTGKSNPGTDRAYKVTVGPGQQLTASVVRSATSRDGGTAAGDPSLYLVRGPPDQCTVVPVCLAGDDHGADTAANTVQYTNAGAAAEEVYVIVDSSLSTPVDAFDLTVTLSP